MTRHDLAERRWEAILDLLPGRAGDPVRPAADNRALVDGVLWLRHCGACWSDMPARYGNGLGDGSQALRAAGPRRGPGAGVLDALQHARCRGPHDRRHPHPRPSGCRSGTGARSDRQIHRPPFGQGGASSGAEAVGNLLVMPGAGGVSRAEDPLNTAVLIICASSATAGQGGRRPPLPSFRRRRDLVLRPGLEIAGVVSLMQLA
ncbi:transposase [Dankookia rubra]